MSEQTNPEQSNSREGIRVFTKHSKDCFLKDDPAPFVSHVGTSYGLNKHGVGRGGWAWHNFRCNDPGCPALVGVRIDVLADWIGRG